MACTDVVVRQNSVFGIASRLYGRILCLGFPRAYTAEFCVWDCLALIALGGYEIKNPDITEAQILRLVAAWSNYWTDEGRLIHDIVKHVLSMKRVPKTPIHYYDVFLNHRGKDVKNTLASNLYYRLRDEGLRVFFDKEEMQKGNRINFVIENAIKGTHVHVAIFSTGYAQSEWCMDELLLMTESGSIIIPVFYDVKPTEMWSNPVDGTNGVYAEALRLLEEEKTFDRQNHQERPRYKSSTIEKWKKTVMEVTGREGFKLETYDGNEGKLLDMIVQEVVKYKVKDDEAKKL